MQKEVTPLIWATYQGNVKLAEILLSSGANIDLTGPVRLYPLGLKYRLLSFNPACIDTGKSPKFVLLSASSVIVFYLYLYF